MAPYPEGPLWDRSTGAPSSAPVSTGPTEEAQTREQAIVEAWAQGFNVGAVVFLILIVLCNYRRRVLLHKLILLELFFALWHGTFIFFRDPVYGWYLSSTAIPLYLSYSLHNVVSWLKIRPFLPKWGGRFFIITLLLAQPYWILEMWANFEYFNGLGSRIFTTSRFVEPAARDPWWIFTTVKLCLVIKSNYDLTLYQLVKASPRFGILLMCMFFSIVFLVTDVIVTAKLSTQSGINPYWRLALVFKCASDTVFLDDFKAVLDRIVRVVMKRVANLPFSSKDDGMFGGPGGGSSSHNYHENSATAQHVSYAGRYHHHGSSNAAASQRAGSLSQGRPPLVHGSDSQGHSTIISSGRRRSMAAGNVLDKGVRKWKSKSMRGLAAITGSGKRQDSTHSGGGNNAAAAGDVNSRHATGRDGKVSTSSWEGSEANSTRSMNALQIEAQTTIEVAEHSGGGHEVYWGQKPLVDENHQNADMYYPTYQRPRSIGGGGGVTGYDVGENPFATGDDILNASGSTLRKEETPVADYQWAMAKEEMEKKRGRDVDTSIPMMPMRAKMDDR